MCYRNPNVTTKTEYAEVKMIKQMRDKTAAVYTKRGVQLREGKQDGRDDADGGAGYQHDTSPELVQC